MTGPSARTCTSLAAHLRAALQRAPLRILAAFFLFGLINNVLYVVILSAALDLVGPRLPKGLVLLFDVVPSFMVKLVAPHFIHAVPYATRVPLIAGLAALGMLLVALSPPSTAGGPVAAKLAGVVLASASSGAGELSFLGLTHHYGHASLAAWGSGTGAAGLVGAGVYALATTVLGWGVRATLLGSAVLPLGMVLSFFAILPRRDTQPVATYAHVPASAAIEAEIEDEGFVDGPDPDRVDEGLLSQGRKHGAAVEQSWLAGLRATLHRAKGLFWPFMVPLLLVYVAEYTINQGLFPVLLFPLAGSPFKHYRAFYPTYNAIYQVGVFISRSSTPFFRIHNLYFPSFLQIGNLGFLILQALFDFVPSVYLIFLIVFWEGLLGGLVYVNTFAEILDTVPHGEREFSLSATSVSDSGGICIAGFIGMALEVSLCSYQVSHGRNFCRKL